MFGHPCSDGIPTGVEAQNRGENERGHVPYGHIEPCAVVRSSSFGLA